MIGLLSTWVCYFAVFYLGCLGVGLLYRRGFLPLHLSALIGVGAYVFAALSGSFGIMAGLFAVLVTSVVSLMSGLVLVRVRGAAAALATISMQFLFDRYVSTASWTGGSAGTALGFPIPSALHKIVASLIAILTCCFLYVMFQRTNASRLLIVDGHTPLLTASANFTSPIIPIVVVSLAVGFCAGLAGLLLVLQTGFIAPANFSLNWSLLYSGTILLAGWHRPKTIAIGAFLLALLPELLRFVGFGQSDWSAWRGVVVGFVVALVVWRQFPRMITPVRVAIMDKVETSEGTI